MDDIDDLLDEVERDFLSPKNNEINKNSRKVSTKTVIRKRHDATIDCDIDDILDAVDFNPEMQDPVKRPIHKRLSDGDGASKNTIKKCFPLYLGGTEITRGMSDSCRKKACNNLRCTSCDFKVICFRDFLWNRNVDYLFFRNTVPDESKLRSKLTKHKGTVAYCCQCSWKSANELTAISKCKDLKWVCGKH